VALRERIGAAAGGLCFERILVALTNTIALALPGSFCRGKRGGDG